MCVCVCGSNIHSFVLLCFLCLSLQQYKYTGMLRTGTIACRLLSGRESLSGSLACSCYICCTFYFAKNVCTLFDLVAVILHFNESTTNHPPVPPPVVGKGAQKNTRVRLIVTFFGPVWCHPRPALLLVNIFYLPSRYMLQEAATNHDGEWVVSALVV